MRHIGIAVITTGHRELPAYPQVQGAEFIVFEDTHLRGPAWARNQALRLLDDCAHVFLLDDEFSLRPTDLLRSCAELQTWKLDYAEAFQGRVTYQTPRALRLIGGYDERHGRYGLERHGRTVRAERAGLRAQRHIADPTLASCILPLAGRASLLSDEEKEAHIRASEPIYKLETRGDCFRAYHPQ